jgi:uncharacterized protein YdbL (DUF1318 family)
MKRIATVLIPLVLGVVTSLPRVALAQRDGTSEQGDEQKEKRENPRKAELQERFRERDSELDANKKDGKIGETTEGLIDFVKSEFREDRALKRLVDEENKDRAELYEIIAKETGATPAVVAEQNARRNYQRARPGEYLKTAGGEWRQKK